MPLVFPFDPNIARASTIPARLYNDPVYLELERERIFAHTWQLVGRVEQDGVASGFVAEHEDVVVVGAHDELVDLDLGVLVVERHPTSLPSPVPPLHPVMSCVGAQEVRIDRSAGAAVRRRAEPAPIVERSK